MSGLHFVVFGVARSGTTALERAINLQPDLFCAHERIVAFEPRERDTLIRDMLEQPDGGVPAIVRSKDALRRKVESGLDLRVGDKVPNYFFSLPKIAARNPGIRLLMILRDPVPVALSWDRRARRRKDRSWDRGKLGCFALFDHAFCLYAAATQVPWTRILSYRALFHERAALMRDVVAFLSPSQAAAYPLDAFVEELFGRAPPQPPAAEAEAYAGFCAAVGAPAITGLVDARGFAEVGTLAGTLVPFSLAMAGPCAEFVMRSVRAMDPEDRQAAMRFGVEWLGHYRRFLKETPDRTAMHAAIEELCGFFLPGGV